MIGGSAVATGGWRRRSITVAVAIALALLLAFFYSRATTDLDYRVYYTLLKAVPSKDFCALPRPDPWDPTIRKYIAEPQKLVCKRLQAELSYLDDDGLLHMNGSAATEAGHGALDCRFRCFARDEGVDDVTLVYTPWRAFTDRPVRVDCEFIEAQCWRRTFPAVSVYTNLHNQIIVREDRLKQLDDAQQARAKPKSDKDEDQPDQPSVVLFVLDSVSHSNWIRNLPKTLRVLTEDYGATVFDGFNKVGDNSFPNAVAFLTGKRVQTAGCASELPEDMSKTFFDDWPLIWKDFHKAGYLTLYAEDYPEYNLFKYLAIGFKNQPTDHYFRPFWLQLYGSFLHRRSTHLCYGNNPCHQLQLNYLRQFFSKYEKRRPKFVLNWLTELGHDWLNQVAMGDDDLAEFFTKLQPTLKDSYVFVFSDHGHRFDAIRQSVVGRVEERMPFFSLSAPQALHRRQPQLRATLRNNSQTLTSFFDLHETLRDILDGSRLDLPREAGARGRSLLRPLAPGRTCHMAGVPEDFCVCQQETLVNVSDERVRAAADALISHVNALLKDYATECARLSLADIRHAQTFLPNMRVVLDPSLSLFYGGKQPRGFFVNYRVTVEAEPSRALFEGTLRTSARDRTFTVVGDVNRINRYGNQSACVKKAFLRKYCYCLV